MCSGLEKAGWYDVLTSIGLAGVKMYISCAITCGICGKRNRTIRKTNASRRPDRPDDIPFEDHREWRSVRATQRNGAVI